METVRVWHGRAGRPVASGHHHYHRSILIKGFGSSDTSKASAAPLLGLIDSAGADFSLTPEPADSRLLPAPDRCGVCPLKAGRKELGKDPVSRKQVGPKRGLSSWP